MEIKTGTLVVVFDVDIKRGFPNGEEIGLVLGVHDGEPFVRSKSFKGYKPWEKLVPICQTELDGTDELPVCDEEKLKYLILQHFPEVICFIAREIVNLKGRTDWLVENKAGR